MEVRFESPEVLAENVNLGCRYQADIYLSGKKGVPEMYRVMIGLYGAENPGYKNFIDFHEISDFMNGPDIERWVDEQVTALRKEGKRVEFDDSASYQLGMLIEQSRGHCGSMN